MINYICSKEVGKGAFSAVYKCFRADTKEQFAVKVFPKHNLKNEEDINRFQREINIMAFTHHENIISMRDCFSDEENFYLVMNLCKGGELSQYVEKNLKLNENIALILFKQIYRAVYAFHTNGISHRDLKPHNILFTEFPHIVVADLGFAKYSEGVKDRNDFCGTICYAAPECFNKTFYDPFKSDIWSLGVILYYMVVGNHPWGSSNESIVMRNVRKANYKIPSSVSKDCADLISKMLKLNPDERISLKDISNHPWVKDHFSTKEMDFQISKTKIKTPENTDFIKYEKDRGIYSPFNENIRNPKKLVTFLGGMQKSNSFVTKTKKYPIMLKKRRETEPKPLLPKPIIFS